MLPTSILVKVPCVEAPGSNQKDWFFPNVYNKCLFRIVSSRLPFALAAQLAFCEAFRAHRAALPLRAAAFAALGARRGCGKGGPPPRPASGEAEPRDDLVVGSLSRDAMSMMAYVIYLGHHLRLHPRTHSYAYSILH